MQSGADPKAHNISSFSYSQTMIQNFDSLSCPSGVKGEGTRPKCMCLLGETALVPGREIGQDNVTIGLHQLTSPSHGSENIHTMCQLAVNPLLYT